MTDAVLAPQPIDPHGRFLRIADVVATTGLSRATIYDRIDQGRFPKPRRYPGSNRAVFWVEAEIADWKTSVLAEIDAEQGQR